MPQSSRASFTDADRDGRLDQWVPTTDDSACPQADHRYRGASGAGFQQIDGQAGIEAENWYCISDLNAGRVRCWA